MQSQRILIAYATNYGQTAKIARRIDNRLTARGFVVRLMSVEQATRDQVLQDFGAVIIGGSVMFGHHRRSLVRFVRMNHNQLNAIPSALFSVSGSAASRNPSSQANAQRYIAQLLDSTGWSPAISTTFGGAVAYSRYNPLLRFVMKRIARKEGLPTDTSRDYEATDWAAVERFVEDVAAIVQQSPMHATAGGTGVVPVGWRD